MFCSGFTGLAEKVGGVSFDFWVFFVCMVCFPNRKMFNAISKLKSRCQLLTVFGSTSRVTGEC